MSTIIGTKRGEALAGKSGSDTMLGLGGDDRITGNGTGIEMLVDGSFETAKMAERTWGTHTTVGGWQTDTSIEIWGKDFLGVKATDGDKIVELDSDRQFSRIWQDVTTEKGQIYHFTFDYAARGGTKLATNSIEVYWNGELVGTFDPASTAWAKGELELVGTGGLDRLEFREQMGDNDSLGGLIDNVSLKTVGEGADEIFGGSGNDVIDGLDGNDVIYGGGKPQGREPSKEATVADNDVIRAGAGDDAVYGGHGDDQLYGEAGKDALFGGRGNDTIDGGIGDDKLFGNSGDDVMADGAGNDDVSGDRGDDFVVAGYGDDHYVGGTGIDTLTFRDARDGVRVDLSKHVATGMGTDRIDGFERIEGSALRDVLKGSKHEETLVGGAGNDRIRGMGGSDVLAGGEGSDTFVYKAADLENQYSDGSVDRIVDFSKEDRLDLTSLRVGESIEKLLAIKDDGTDTHVYIDLGGGYREIAVLENFTGYDVHSMLENGILLA
jgi:Ca2+-binding RTX toxin-like protein